MRGPRALLVVIARGGDVGSVLIAPAARQGVQAFGLAPASDSGEENRPATATGIRDLSRPAVADGPTLASDGLVEG
jgi:hypothetical protein